MEAIESCGCCITLEIQCSQAANPLMKSDFHKPRDLDT